MFNIKQINHATDTAFHGEVLLCQSMLESDVMDELLL